MGPAAHRQSGIAVTLIAAVLASLSAVPTMAQSDDPTASMCLLTLEEVSDATGLPFATMDESRGSCTYASDPAVDMYALDLRIDTDPTLDSVRFEYDRGGQDTTVAGFPAWASEDGLFVDVGDRLLVVQPILFLSDTAVDPVDVQLSAATLAADRVGSAIEATFGSEDRLKALFPAEFAGLPTFVEVMAADDFLRFVDLGTAGIEAILAEQGLTLADMSIATTTMGDGDVIAMQVPGLDASLLVPPVSERLASLGGAATPEVRGGRELLAYPDQSTWLYASGDVLWLISQADEATLDAVLEVLP